MLNIYGLAFKELIHEEFGDGIMSAIDFRVGLEREPSEQGDRVKMVWSGKFLPYKRFWIASIFDPHINQQWTNMIIRILIH